MRLGQNGEAIVEVSEGVVSVTQSSVTPNGLINADNHIALPILLKVGQKARFSNKLDATLISEAKIEDIAAWRMKQLIFEGATLNEIAKEFNRYNHTKLIIEGDTLQQERIYGVFFSDDPTSFIDFLKLVNEIDVVENKSELRIRRINE